MAKILGSLPSKYSALVTAWDSVGPENQTLQNLTDRLIKEESRMTLLEETSALAAVKMNSKTQTWSEQKKNVECFYCKIKGHVIKFCRKKKRDMEYI